MLHVEQISKSFGSTQAVSQLDLSVENGQICGLLGPNGAGKTTAIRMICGVLIPQAGRIEIGGVPLATEPKKAKQLLGYVPEGAPLPSELLPIEYLFGVASLYGLKGSEKESAVHRWADRCDVTNVLRKPIGSLSRGYKQRVALASALLHEPKLVVLDEPSTGLDPVQRTAFHQLLRDVSTDAAILYSSHHLAEVEATCDVVAIINHGKLLKGHSFTISENITTLTVEVSSKEIVSKLQGKKSHEVEDGWFRCEVEQAGENIVEVVQQQGGKIRLLQPTIRPLEEKYLQLLEDSESQSETELHDQSGGQE
jgi:ABC-2 type transport system ATP-binding protein